MEDKDIIAQRVAQEIQPDTLVNLGIGLPSLVANFLPKDVHVFFQAENGVVGLGPRPPEGMEDEDLTDAGGGFVTAMPGAASIDSAMSFGLIRGGHLDMTVLGGLQVDERGYLANWMVPGKMVPGMGGAMDLVAGAKHVIVAMVHTAKGDHKIVPECTLPLTATRRVSLIVTEMAVIEPTERGPRPQGARPGRLGRGHRQGDRREADHRGRHPRDEARTDRAPRRDGPRFARLVSFRLARGPIPDPARALRSPPRSTASSARRARISSELIHPSLSSGCAPRRARADPSGSRRCCRRRPTPRR